MPELCLVCNATEPHANYIKDVFSERLTLPSTKNLSSVLREILNEPLEKDAVHSKFLCRQCFSKCVDYDDYQSKMVSLKSLMSKEYTKTKEICTVSTQVTKKDSAVVERRINKVVVPASKLQPLPPDFQLNIGQLGAVSRAAINKTQSSTPQFNLKVTIGSSVFTQSLKSSVVKISKPADVQTTPSIQTSKAGSWSIEIPKDIFSNNDEGGDENGDDDAEVEERDMEIDEECALVVPSDNPEDSTNIKTEPGQGKEDNLEYINVSVLPSGGQLVLGDLSIFRPDGEDGDEQHTIVVNGDNSSILEMMTSQKLIYKDGQLIVMDEPSQNLNGDDDHDSNDESQIELQVSGDEETANAIIAAAQKKGGAFIKVESGEMYRVESVQSKTTASVDMSSFFVKDGGKFKCAMCADDDENDEEENALTPLDASAMMQHLKSKHDVIVYICHFCGIGVRKRQEYYNHLGEHTGHLKPQKGKTHDCTVCHKRYNSKTLLQEHMNTHTGERPYVCDICFKRFASKYTHMAHLKTHENRPRPFTCEKCDKSFLSKQNLIQHVKTHYGVKNFICKVCNKGFASQHNLEVHGVVHSGEKPYACEHCPKAFARKAELFDHLRTHTGERPFECTTCGARFAQRSNLHSHRRATHMDDKRHCCQFCPKRFKRRRLLQYHIKASHTGERPLKCDICHATFVYPEHHKKHMRIHSGERPYFCEICGKSFNSCDNRNTHRFTHSDKKPYECLQCGLSYMRKRLLIAHMQSRGHLAESIVVNQPRVSRVNESGVSTYLIDPISLSQDGSDQSSEPVLQTTCKIEQLTNPVKTISGDSNDMIKPLFSADTLDETNEIELAAAMNSNELETQTAQLGDEVVRLVQVKLPDGNSGWVAIDTDYTQDLSVE